MLFNCVFVTLTYGVLDQVCYLIVLIPDLYLRFYFNCECVIYILFCIKMKEQTLLELVLMTVVNPLQ